MNRIDELREYYDNTDTSAELEQAEYIPADAPPAAERMTTFAVRLPVPVLERVRQIANSEGVTTSEMLRRWIVNGITAYDDTRSDVREGGSIPVDVLLDVLALSRYRRRRGLAGALRLDVEQQLAEAAARFNAEDVATEQTRLADR